MAPRKGVFAAHGITGEAPPRLGRFGGRVIDLPQHQLGTLAHR